MEGGPVMMTSGASGRLRSLLSQRTLYRLFLSLHSLFLWLFLLLRFARRPLNTPVSPRVGGLALRRGRRDEEIEDALRRRALAEEVPMLDADGEDCDLRWDTWVFVGKRRNSLFCRSWVPVGGDMRGILIIIHGLNEHCGRYAHFAKQLIGANFGVYAMDWIGHGGSDGLHGYVPSLLSFTGHGGSDGLHGYVPSLDHVVADTGAFIEKIKSENPGVPFFLFGHSTGGAVVLKAASYPHIRSNLEGIIMMSPALRVKPAHPIVGAVAPVFAVVLPKFQFKGANKRGIPVSRDPAALVAKYSDPLVYTGPIRVRTGYEILRISAHLMQNIRAVTVPFLVLHGTADKVTDPLASQDLYNEAASRYKAIKLYDGLLHDLLFEPERDEIGADIIDWMERRLPNQRQ